MIGKTISHFKIIDKIGAGGMGEVYLAEDTELARKVALKFLPVSLTTDPELQARFRHEARAAAALNHPNIVTVHEIGEYEGTTYIAMEYVEGETLRVRLKRGLLSANETVNIVSQICHGLQKALEADIVHRDLKPENILIDKDGRVRIVDFGLARLGGATRLTRESSTLGTLHYMAPEQFQGLEADHRADIWAIGVILYELLQGKVPFEGDYEAAVMYSVLNEEPDPINTSQDDFLNALEKIAKKALAKNPEDRYQEVGSLLADLSSKEESEVSASPSQKSKPRKQGSSFKLMAGLVTLLLAVFITVYFSGFPVDMRGLVNKLTLGSSENELTSIAVMYFDNLTGKPELDLWEYGTTELLINELARHPELEVLDPQTIYFLQQERNKNEEKQWNDALALELASTLKVDVALFGQLFQGADEVSLRFKLLDVPRRLLLGADELKLSNVNEMLDKIGILSSRVVGHLQVQDLEKATEYFDPKSEGPAARTRSVLAYTHYLKGNRNFMEFRWPQALSEFSQAIREDSSYVIPYFVSCMIHMNMRNSQAAEDLLKRARVAINSPSYQEELLLNAIEATLALDFDQEVGIYSQLLSVNPGHRGWHYAIGYAYCNLGEYDTAIPHLEKAYFSKWKLPFVEAQLVRAYHYVGNYERELEMHAEWQAKFPQSPWYYLRSVRTGIISGNEKQKQTAIQTVLDKSQEFGWASDLVNLQVSKYYLEVSDFKTARTYVGEVLQLDSANVEALYTLGHIELKAGNDKAVQDIIAAIELSHPGSPHSNVLAAYLAMSRSRYEETKQFLDKIDDPSRIWSDFQFCLARSLEESGNTAAARREYARLIALTPALNPLVVEAIERRNSLTNRAL